jgi:hypothetical protein
MTLETRHARIEAFHRLLRELPAGPDRDAEMARRSGMTDLDFRWLINDTERADRQADAMMEWHEAQQSAWRREIIAWLTRWDELTAADRQAFIVLVRDLFQCLAREGGLLPLPSGPQIDPGWRLLTGAGGHGRRCQKTRKVAREREVATFRESALGSLCQDFDILLLFGNIARLPLFPPWPGGGNLPAGW